MQNNRSGLGTGLASLLGPEIFDEVKTQDIQQLNVDDIQSCSFQPRKYFKGTELEELAESIRQNGVLQPVIVRPLDNQKYELIAGERRWRACKIAGLRFIPVIIKEATDREVLRYAIIENIQRENLSPLEESESYDRLRQEYDYSHEELAKILGKSRSYISNTLRLCSLPPHIKELIELYSLTAGHARALLGLPVDEQLQMIENINSNTLSVRQVEKAVQEKKESNNSKASDKKSPKQRSKEGSWTSPDQQDIAAIESHLSELLNSRVTIQISGEQPILKIECGNYEVLDICVERLSVG
jgi:ParB family transcriptional regulator, chromosome partitioning protein